MLRNTIFILSLITFLFATNSCSKGCDFPEDVRSGIIIEDAYVLGVNSSGEERIYRDTLYGGEKIKVSFDEGYSYVPVDYSKYSVVNFPVTVGCNTHFEREVTRNDGMQNVKYKLTVESCPDCENDYSVENWVLIPAVPANYYMVYEKKVK